MAINPELEALYNADKQERETLDEKNPEAWKLLDEHDRERKQRALALLPSIDLNEIWNCHYLALLFQHGETEEDYEMAHRYAKMAVDMGSNVTKWLFAATLDRWLVAQGLPQNYGTQYHTVNGEVELFPVDETVTDEEREWYGVPRLEEMRKRVEGMNSEKGLGWTV